MRGTRRGASIASALLLGALAMTLAFTMAGVSFTHLNMATRLSNQQVALNLAEMAATRAMDQVLASEGDFGSPGSAGPNSLEVSYGSDGMNAQVPGDAVGLVSFDAGQAAGWGIPQSFNNLDGDEPVAGFQRQVPLETVQIVAVGRCNGVERTVEAILAVPTYPFAIATSGRFATPGGLLVAGLESEDALTDDLTIDPEELLPGHLRSNAENEDAVVLESDAGNKTTITGDVETRGQVTLGSDTEVRGEVVEGADETELPDIDVSEYDPGDKALAIPAYHVDSVKISNGVRRSANDVVMESDLTLDDGVLYVNGDLTVKDGVSGVGAVIATGKVTIEGQGTLQAGRRVAVIAGGDVTIKGEGEHSSYFQGLVYSKGSRVEVKNATFVGALVANGVDTDVSVEDARILHSQIGGIEFEYDFKISGGNGFSPLQINQRISRYLRLDTGNWDDPKEKTHEQPPDWLGQAPAWTSWWDPSKPPDGGFPTTEAELIARANLRQNASGEWIVDVKVDPEGDGTFVTKTVPVLEYHSNKLDQYVSRDVAKAEWEKLGAAMTFEETEQAFWNDAYGNHSELTDGLAIASAWTRPDPGMIEGKFTFDPNRFFQLQDKARVTLWREL